MNLNKKKVLIYPKIYENEKKLKIIEYMKNYYLNQLKNKNIFKNKIINLNCRDRYILFKIYEFVKENYDLNKSCYLQKHNITYFNENKERYIKYYEMVKNSNRNINYLNELLFLGKNNFDIKFCSKKKYLNNSLIIKKGSFIVTFDM
jgi:hypothetical protein